MPLVSINPTTGQQIATYPEMSASEVGAALAATSRAFAEWRRASFADRGAVLRAVAAVLRRRKSEFARLMAIEMGKPLGQGEAEIEKCASTCDYCAEDAARFLDKEEV